MSSGGGRTRPFHVPRLHTILPTFPAHYQPCTVPAQYSPLLASVLPLFSFCSTLWTHFYSLSFLSGAHFYFHSTSTPLFLQYFMDTFLLHKLSFWSSFVLLPLLLTFWSSYRDTLLLHKLSFWSSFVLMPLLLSFWNS